MVQRLGTRIAAPNGCDVGAPLVQEEYVLEEVAMAKKIGIIGAAHRLGLAAATPPGVRLHPPRAERRRLRRRSRRAPPSCASSTARARPVSSCTRPMTPPSPSTAA